MHVNSISNGYSPHFGSSFRVGIYVKSPDGTQTTFVHPAKEIKLYQNLNSRIVRSLNDDFINNLRNSFGIERKKEQKPWSAIYRKLVSDLRNIDGDYKKFNFTRSVYRRHQLGFIVTGSDVPIVESILGVRSKAAVKRNAQWYGADLYDERSGYIATADKKKAIEYARSENVLLRSENNKEIMLNVFFKEVGTDKNGNKKYALDDYEFHENKSLPDLKPVSEDYLSYKQSLVVNKYIFNTVRDLLDNMTKKRLCFSEYKIKEFIESLKKAPEKSEAGEIKEATKPNYPSGTQLKIDFQG